MTGIFILFKVEQSNIIKIIEEQIEEGIPEEELHFFRLSKNEYEQLDWKRKAKDFRLDGNMFDVVRSEFFQDSIELQCIQDIEEAELLSRIDDALQKTLGQNSDENDSPLNKVVKIFKGAYVANEFTCQLDFHSAYSTSYCQLLNLFYFSPSLEKLVPPPNRV